MIFQQTKLTCSIGVGTNKLIAKIAASRSKPNGLKMVPEGEEISFLAPLPVQTLPGVGTKTQESLNHDGIESIADLQALGMEELIDRYGSHGYYLHLASCGKDSRPVEGEDQPPKSLELKRPLKWIRTIGHCCWRLLGSYLRGSIGVYTGIG